MAIRSSSAVAIATVCFVSVGSISNCAANDLEGTWEVKNSGGNPFDITLLADGKATSTLHPDQTGVWKEQGSAAVITWSTGWTSKIEKVDGHYNHTAYRPGQPLNSSPNNTSDAERVR